MPGAHTLAIQEAGTLPPIENVIETMVDYMVAVFRHRFTSFVAKNCPPDKHGLVGTAFLLAETELARLAGSIEKKPTSDHPIIATDFPVRIKSQTFEPQEDYGIDPSSEAPRRIEARMGRMRKALMCILKEVAKPENLFDVTQRIHRSLEAIIQEYFENGKGILTFQNNFKNV